MDRITVVGLGAMGLGIVQTYAQAGFKVAATDAAARARVSAVDRLAEPLAARVAAGKMTADDRDALLSRITILRRQDDIGPCALLIEAVVEALAVKRDLFEALELQVGPGTVLATNTSALSIAAIARTLTRPDRLIGLHFFNPAPVMKLVELVGHAGSSEDALARARALTEQAGKTVIRAADRPGFIVNRCARPYYGEALAMLEEGRTPSEIDAAMLAAGYRMGPFSLIDLIGADVNLAATEGLHMAMGSHPRYHPFSALRTQVDRGAFGRKSGNGFLWPAEPGPPPPDAGAIRLRIEAALANEAASLADEGGTTADDIDRAMKLGLNFPRGPFESTRALGVGAVIAELERLDSMAPAHLRGRYTVCQALRRMV
jgi:3-hydroxybutyryl-CoA dehydrogenase